MTHCKKAHFVWIKNGGCSIRDGNRNIIGHTDTLPPHRVFVHFNRIAGISRIVQYGGNGLVYLTYKGQKYQLHYDTLSKKYSIDAT